MRTVAYMVLVFVFCNLAMPPFRSCDYIIIACGFVLAYGLFKLDEEFVSKGNK